MKKRNFLHKAWKVLILYPFLLTVECLLLFTLNGCILRPSQEIPNKDSRTFTQLILHFKKSGLDVKKIYPLQWEIIHADAAISVQIGKGKNREVGIYKFNTSFSKPRKKLTYAIKHGYIYILGIKYKAKINGAFMMVGYERHPDKDKIIKAFKTF